MYLFRVISLVWILLQISCGDKSSDDIISIANEPPVAAAKADKNSGIVPLKVQFSGSSSTDDQSISSYLWDFKNGMQSKEKDPLHTFEIQGIYAVELIVKDNDGLFHKDTVSITVESVNESPVAVVSADVMVGDAPLQVNFTGKNSFDDKEISSYRWEFKDGYASSLANPTHTFETPGEYYVDLFVTDLEGLSNFAGVTIVVGQEPCYTDGGYANDTGLKIWCWEDMNVPSGESTGRDGFNNDELALSVECSENQVVKEGNRLKFILTPTNPLPLSWCNNDFNFRSEIRTLPWQVNQPLATEEWIGWSYTFGENYQIDRQNPWLFFQMQQGIPGSPPHELAVVHSGLYGAQDGEVVVINEANKTETDRTLTGIVPQAGTTLNIVVHVIHDLGSKGLLQVWINDEMVYNKKVGTVHDWAPWGGNAKFGIYKWPWREAEGVQKSLDQGIDRLETYMGPLRIITRKSGDIDYGKDSYAEVVPR